MSCQTDNCLERRGTCCIDQFPFSKANYIFKEEKDMKRVLSLVLVLTLVLGSIMPAFAEETLAQETVDLQSYGVVAGDDTGANEAGALKRAEMTVLLSKLYGMQAEAEAYELPGTFEDLDATWEGFVPYINFAKAQGWMSGDNDTTFRPEDAMKAQEVNAMLLKALGYDIEWDMVNEKAEELGIAVVAADDTLVLRGEGFKAIRAALDKMPMDKEMTLGEELELTNYVAPVVVPEAYEMTAAMSGVKQADVTFNMPVEDTDAVTIKLMKGAAIYSSTVTWNEEKTVATVATVINLPAADYTVEVTGLEDEALTQTITVAAEAVGSIEVTPTTLDDATAAAQVAFVVKNQYGEDMKKNADVTGLVVSGFNVTQGAAITVAQPTQKYFTINTAATADEFKKDDVVRLIVSYAGLTETANIVVQDPAANATISLGAVELAKDDVRLNVSDATVKLGYTLLDQYGAEVKLTASQANAGAILTADKVNFISSNTGVISGFTTNADKELVLTIAGSGTATITAVVNATGSVSTTQVVVEADGAAKTATIAAPTMLVAGKDAKFDLATTVLDQYGDVVKSNSGLTVAAKAGTNAEVSGAVLTLSAKADTVTVDPSALAVTATRTLTVELKKGTDVLGTVDIVIEPDAVASQVTAAKATAIFEAGSEYDYLAADFTVLDQYGRAFTKGTPVITVVTDTASIVDSIANDDELNMHATNVGTATLKVTVDAGPTLDFTVKAIATADVKSYTLTHEGDVYASTTASYHVAPVLKGVDADGNAVVLKTGKVTLFTSADVAIAKISSSKVEGVKAGTVEITAWSGATKLASTTVTISEAAPVATTVKLTAGTVANTTDLITVLEIKDQYGVIITTAQEALGAWVTSDAAVVNASGVAAGGGTATVSFITVNGLISTADFTVTP
jgi:hypothetical protein